jgi:hypothetical protein
LDLIIKNFIILGYQVQIVIVFRVIFWSIALLFVVYRMSFLKNNVGSLRVSLFKILSFKLGGLVLFIDINYWAIILWKVHFIFLINFFFWYLVDLKLVFLLSLKICDALLKITESHFMHILFDLRIWCDFDIFVLAHLQSLWMRVFKIILVALLIFIPDFTGTYISTTVHSFLVLKSSWNLDFCSRFFVLFHIFLFKICFLIFYFRVSWRLLNRNGSIRLLLNLINLFIRDLR